MEKIIDRILSDFRWTPKLFNDFCSENNLDKSSRSAFKGSLENTIKELSSERDQIEKNLPPYTIERDIKRIEYNFTLDKRVPVYRNRKVYDKGIDIEKAERDEKRKDELKEKIFYLDEMLQRVNLYTGKETTPTKKNENNVPGLIQFDEPLKSKIEEINSLIFNSELGGVSIKTVKSDIKFQLQTFYKKNFESLYFTTNFPNYETFIRKVFPHLKKSNLNWKLEQFVKTLSNKF